MKLRIKGNSIRLRVSRSELSGFSSGAPIAETVYFGAAPGAQLTYALLHRADIDKLALEYQPGRFDVVMPSSMARMWAETDQVGIAASVDLGANGTLTILVEKDFACLDRTDGENADTFPNPLAGQKC